ncbi:MAG: DUF444 family protein [Burkholderiales bacterium]
MSPFRNIAAESPWYDLFSRGARDWLRHNDKVRDAVKHSLPDLVSGPDALTNTQDRTVKIPVKLLEHARFRLADADEETGVGQGQGEPGDVLRPGHSQGGGDEAGQGGNNQGEFQLAIEFKMDEIVDWLWEELKLPDLKPKQTPATHDEDWVREGWDKHGPRARLDRRRTMKEAIKRRSVQPGAAPFSNEDLRFRQITRRPKPANQAVVVFALDVSGSMNEAQRKLAKTFFFFALQGIRREYSQVETVFLAHTDEAWEFSEQEFFQATGSGGTVASSVFQLSLDVFNERFDAARYNRYLFYASDGENFREDRMLAMALLTELAKQVNYIGYVQTGTFGPAAAQTELAQIAAELKSDGLPVGYALLSRHEEIWQAIRIFFQEQAMAET